MTNTTWPPQGLGRAEYSKTDSVSQPHETLGGTGTEPPWVQLGAEVAPTFYCLSASFTQWIEIPEAPERLDSPLPRMIQEIRTWTGWSQRELGEILHTSHTTVRKLETDGRVTSRSRHAASLVPDLHNVVRRVSLVARGDLGQISEAFAARDANGISAASHLINENYARAYSSALHALRGGRTAMVAPSDDSQLPDATVEMI
ncbi:helix-turn-helix domain-containing protein [Streptomyces sp. NBC_00467]|uniref:helix-turn-helix domain-containing protein n=1 Tax=Streptomyces sp. NBC_00467 TaxID=2975752 RepID=UPI002E17BEA6